MKIRNEWSACCLFVAGLLLAVLGWRPLIAQPKRSVLADDLLPADSAIYLRFEGFDSIGAALAKTAAYKSLDGSGLEELVLPVTTRWIAEAAGVAEVPDLRSEVETTFHCLYEHVRRHGLSAGIDVRLLVGEGVFVIPDAAGTELASKVERTIRRCAAHAGHSVHDEMLHGRKVASVRMNPFILSWWVEDRHLVLVGSLIGPGGTLRRARGEEAGLASSPKREIFHRTTPGVRAGVIWLDVQAIVRAFPRIQPIPKVLSLMGVEGMQGVVATWSCDGPAMRTEIDVMLRSPRTGLLQAVDGPRVRLSRLPKLPVDIDTAVFFPFDGKHLYDTVLPAVGEWIRAFIAEDSETLKEHLRKLDAVLGWNMRDDFLAYLGPTGVLYDSPTDGVFGVGGVSIALEVRDHERLRESLDRLAVRIPELDPRFSIARRSFEGAHIWLGSFKDAPYPLTPTVALSEQWLSIGFLSPAQVLRFVRMQKKDGPAWNVPQDLMDKVQASGGSLLAFGHSDPRPTARAILSLLPIGLGVAKNLYPDLEVDLTRLPDVEKVLEPLFPGTMVVTVDNDGIHIVNLSSLPIPGLGPDAGTLKTAGILTALLAPTLESARQVTRGPAARGVLVSLGLAIEQEGSTTGSFPRGTAREAAHLPPEARLSWIAGLLPFLGEEASLGPLDPSKRWNGPENGPTTARPFPMVVHPAAKEAGPRNGTHFVGMAGVGPDAAALPASDPRAGIFGHDRQTRRRDIQDGLNHTILLAGVRDRIGPWGQGGHATVRSFATPPYVGGPDGFGDPAGGVLVVLMADGSVRTFAKDADPRILEALATKAGGEANHLPPTPFRREGSR